MRGMNRFARTAVTLSFLLLATAAGAKWAQIGADVPVSRLIANVGAYVRVHPNEARGWYALGRVHSLAFAQTDAKMPVYYKRDLGPHRAAHPTTANSPLPPDELPEFYGPNSSMEGKYQIKPPDWKRQWKAESRLHLLESLRSYQRATTLAPNNGLYWLGLGWMLEQARDAQAHGGSNPDALTANAPDWSQQAIAAYQRAYELTYPEDSKQERRGPTPDIISQEAGEGMLRLMKGRALTPTEAERQARLQTEIAKLKSIPRMVTPIIFPLRGQTTLAQLMDAHRATRFDLAGDGRGARWPWVTPDTGILVWDPAHTGHITSGRQLFGSATWWMLFENGYQALASLDDNHDGQISGRELDGIAVWQDRNGNGQCDRGEVVSLSSLGIVSIAVRSVGQQNGALCNARGLQLADGTFLATYDWTPTSK